MRLKLSQPSIAGVGAGAELGNISMNIYVSIQKNTHLYEYQDCHFDDHYMTTYENLY